MSTKPLIEPNRALHTAPHIQRVLEVDRKIRELRAEQEALLQTVIQDCEFMDVPILRLLKHDTWGRIGVGDRCHLLKVEREWGGLETTIEAHSADGCQRERCGPPGSRLKWPRHSHIGRRSFHTRLQDHVCVGVEQVVLESVYGDNPVTQYAFVSAGVQHSADRGEQSLTAASSKPLRRGLGVNEQLRGLDD